MIGRKYSHVVLPDYISISHNGCPPKVLGYCYWSTIHYWNTWKVTNKCSYIISEYTCKKNMGKVNNYEFTLYY